MLDRNRLLVQNFDEIVRLCGGDSVRAREVYLVLTRSYRYERLQEERRRAYPIRWIYGKPVRLKYDPPKEGLYAEEDDL